MRAAARDKPRGTRLQSRGQAGRGASSTVRGSGAADEIGEGNRQSGRSKREGESVGETVEKPAGRVETGQHSGVGPGAG